jgi:hypothetical protein
VLILFLSDGGFTRSFSDIITPLINHDQYAQFLNCQSGHLLAMTGLAKVKKNQKYQGLWTKYFYPSEN